MATITPFLLLLLLLATLAAAQTPSAPAPSPPGPVNLTGILDDARQYTTFIKLLAATQVANQIDNQINSSSEGMTVFAPTDNAFNNLKSGALNGLSTQQQVQLVLYHVLPKFYRLNDLLLVSNPVRTQATGQDGEPFGLNFAGRNNQVNVSTGVVETQINTALRQQFPLAVYQVDMVLLPNELFGAKPPAGAPKSPKTKEGSNSTTTPTPASSANEPAPSENANSSGKISVGFGLIAGVLLACMGFLS